MSSIELWRDPYTRVVADWEKPPRIPGYVYPEFVVYRYVFQRPDDQVWITDREHWYYTEKQAIRAAKSKARYIRRIQPWRYGGDTPPDCDPDTPPVVFKPAMEL